VAGVVALARRAPRAAGLATGIRLPHHRCIEAGTRWPLPEEDPMPERSCLPALAAAALALAAAPAQVAIGADAPTLTVDERFNLPDTVHSLVDLRGGAVLLEYWATW
jgi:hypothetical protein